MSSYAPDIKLLAEGLLDSFVASRDEGARSVFLLCDAFCEVAMKAYLEEWGDTHNSPFSVTGWANFPGSLVNVLSTKALTSTLHGPLLADYFLGLKVGRMFSNEHFQAIENDQHCTSIQATHGTFYSLWTRIRERHITRNRMYHNHQLMRHQITQKEAGEALVDALNFAIDLFPSVRDILDADRRSEVLWLYVRLVVHHLTTNNYQVDRELRSAMSELRSVLGGKQVRVRGHHLVKHDDFGYDWIILRHHAYGIRNALADLARRFGV